MISIEELEALREQIVQAQTERLAVGPNIPGNIRWSYETDNLPGCYALIFTLWWFLELELLPHDNIRRAAFRAELLVVATLDRAASNDDPNLLEWQEVHVLGVWLYAWLRSRNSEHVSPQPIQTAVRLIPEAYLNKIAERFPVIAEKGRDLQQEE